MVRFDKPVLPGQTVQTNMWLERDERRVYFECRVVENDTQVISGAYVELHDIKSAASTTTTSTPAKEVPSGKQMAADKIFEEIRLKLQEKPDLAKSINAVYAFQISKDDATKIFGKYSFRSISSLYE